MITLISSIIINSIMFLFLVFLFFYFCIEDNELTYFGKLKQNLFEYFEILFSILPEIIRKPLSNLFKYTFHTRNPIFLVIINFNNFNQAIYLMFFVITMFSFILNGVDVYLPNERVSYNYVIIAYFLFALNFVIFYICCTESPSIINKDNYDRLLKKYGKIKEFYLLGDTCNICKFEM